MKYCAECGHRSGDHKWYCPKWAGSVTVEDLEEAKKKAATLGKVMMAWERYKAANAGAKHVNDRIYADDRLIQDLAEILK